RRRCEVQHVGDLPRDLEGRGDVMLHELEVRASQQVGEVVPVTVEQVVEPHPLVPLVRQPLAQVRAEEAGAAGYHRPAHAGASSRVAARATGRPIEMYSKLAAAIF